MGTDKIFASKNGAENKPKVIHYHRNFFSDHGNNSYQNFKYVFESWQLIVLLIRRDIALRARRSLLGYVWVVFPQFLMVLPLLFLSQRNIVSFGDTEIPFLFHALWGMSCWQLFSSILIGSMTSLANAGSLIGKVNFPKEVLVIASIGGPSFDFLLRLAPLLLLFSVNNFLVSWMVVFLPVIILLITLMALSLGFYLSVFKLLFSDITNAVSIFLTFAIFLCPVFYPPFTDGVYSFVNYVIPFNGLLIVTQDLIVGQGISLPGAFLSAIIFTLINLFLGVRFFQVSMPFVAARV